MNLVKFKKTKKVNGFTIIEALIALVVFTVGALTIAGLLNRSLEMNADSEARTEALHLAQVSISDFRTFKTRAEVVAYIAGSDDNSIPGNNTNFTRSWTVVDVTGNDNVILVTVDVGWTGVNGAQNVSLASEIAKLKPEHTGKFLMSNSVK